jgi:hypothetical protein
MEEIAKGCIELYYDKTQSYEYFSNCIMSNFSIPETQIEQIYILMRIGGKTTMYNNKSEDDLKYISKILSKCNIENKIIIYETKNWT